jgi:hypothetical protein
MRMLGQVHVPDIDLSCSRFANGAGVYVQLSPGAVKRSGRDAQLPSRLLDLFGELWAVGEFRIQEGDGLALGWIVAAAVVPAEEIVSPKVGRSEPLDASDFWVFVPRYDAPFQ